MRVYKLLRLGVALSISALVGETTSAQAQDIQLQFENGNVTLVAREVTIGAILEQWSKVGATTVVNTGPLPTAPLSIELNGVSEPAALKMLLRALPGYVLADRLMPVPGRSQIDRIVLLGSGTTPAPPQSFERPSSLALSTPPVQASTRVRPSLLPEPDEVSTNGIAGLSSNNDADPSPIQGDVIAVTGPGASVGVPGTSGAIGSPRPGMVSAPPSGSSGGTTTAAATGSLRPGEAAVAPQTAPYQLPPPAIPEP